MESYFNLLPRDIINILTLYLKYEDVNNLEEIDVIINWENIFQLKYNPLYLAVKKVFEIDKSVKLYRNCWEILYRDMEYFDYKKILKYSMAGKLYNVYVGDGQASSISTNLIYTIIDRGLATYGCDGLNLNMILSITK